MLLHCTIFMIVIIEFGHEKVLIIVFLSGSACHV